MNAGSGASYNAIIGQVTIIENGVHYTSDQWQQKLIYETLLRIETLLVNITKEDK